MSVAPMMDRTDRHFRYLLRLLSRHALLYTEMLTTGAVLHGDRATLLAYHPGEHPLALQLGGDDPEALATCARIAEDLGFDEVNLNVGCPSDRVQSGCFGAVLMRRPERVADAVHAMRAAVSLPVTVKHRIGVDELDRYEDMARFVQTVAAAGADRFTVHARKAWLSGLSPKENRDIPPLRYGDVYRLAAEHPHLVIEINGGIRSWDDARVHLARVDAVMIGRAAWDQPAMFATVDRDFFDLDAAVPDVDDVARAYALFARDDMDRYGFKAIRVLRCAMNLFAGSPGTRAWKRELAIGSDPVEAVERGLAAVHRVRAIAAA